MNTLTEPDTETHSDPSEPVRRQLAAAINADPNSREALEAKYGQVWDTGELRAEFTVTGFAAPLVIVRRKSDGKLGSMYFQHGPPRLYWGFEPA